MILTDNEWYSFMSGLIVGKHIKKDGNNNVDNAATVNTKPIKTSKYATIGITAPRLKLASRVAQSVQVNIMCTGVNIGVSAFVAKITWSSYLKYTGVDFGDFGSNITIDDSLAISDNTLLVLGQNTANMSIADFILFKINFNMLTIPDNIRYVNINCIRTTGTTMTDCSLLTLNKGNLYYITPSESNNGYLYFDSVDKPIENNPEVILPGPSNFPIGSGGGSVGGTSTGEYRLNGFIGGVGGTGAYLVVELWQNGTLIGFDRQWVNNGNFDIGGNIALENPNPDYGDVSIKIRVEPNENDNTGYYILIPAGGFNIVFTTIVNKGDKSFPKEPIIIQYIESLELLDIYSIEITSNEPIDLDSNIDEITIDDSVYSDIISINILDKYNIDEIGVMDNYSVDIESSIPSGMVDELVEYTGVVDSIEADSLSIVIYDKESLDNLGISDINENDIITTIITDVVEQDDITINDMYDID